MNRSDSGDPGERELQRHLNRIRSRAYDIIRRCYSKKHRLYAVYGGAGVTVDLAWCADVNSFVQYLTTLDGWTDPRKVVQRKDPAKGYVIGNLEFVDGPTEHHTSNSLYERELELLARRLQADSVKGTPRSKKVLQLLEYRYVHTADVLFVKHHHRSLRRVRGNVPIAKLALAAGSTVEHVLQLERGNTDNIEAGTLRQLLEVYTALEELGVDGSEE